MAECNLFVIEPDLPEVVFKVSAIILGGEPEREPATLAIRKRQGNRGPEGGRRTRCFGGRQRERLRKQVRPVGFLEIVSEKRIAAARRKIRLSPKAGQP